jgi:hypothetical protein
MVSSLTIISGDTPETKAGVRLATAIASREQAENVDKRSSMNRSALNPAA